MKNVFCTSFCCGFFGWSLDSPQLKSQILWENFGETLIQDLCVLVRLWFLEVVQVVLRFARESTVWTRSEGSLFPSLLSFTYIVCGCFVKFLCTSVKHSSPLHCLLFYLFLIKSSGGDRWRGRGKKACLVLAWGPRALLWEAVWTVNGGRSHSGGDDTHVYKRTRYCNAHWCQNVKWKVWCPFGIEESDSGDRTRGDEFKCSENSLYGSGWTASRPPASLHETEQTFLTWKAAVTAPGCYLA